MKKVNNLILGAGIAGLSAGYHLNLKNEEYLILEKSSEAGGLCGNFKINGFLFDKFIHLSFTSDDYVKKIFQESSKEIKHISNPYNFYNDIYLKHPAQNNLYPLDKEEKNRILQDFKKRKNKKENEILNYEEWLRVQYGDYFAEKFPMEYTKKYWGKEAKYLSTKWIGNRMYKPSYEEVKLGALTSDTPNTYYAPQMYYPTNGGYKSYLNKIINIVKNKIIYNCEVAQLDLRNKIVIDKNGKKYKYRNLYSSIPLNELVNITKEIEKNYIEESKKLEYTSGYMISIGLKTKDIPPYLWIYIYNNNKLSTRIYSPSLKSKENCPKDCSSIQVEVYFSNRKSLNLTDDEILKKVILELEEMRICKSKDIIVKDIRREEYANIIFTEETYTARDNIKKYYEKNNINLIGRFGEWEYFWSDQSFLSGKKSVEKLGEKNENNK